MWVWGADLGSRGSVKLECRHREVSQGDDRGLMQAFGDFFFTGGAVDMVAGVVGGLGVERVVFEKFEKKSRCTRGKTNRTGVEKIWETVDIRWITVQLSPLVY